MPTVTKKQGVRPVIPNKKYMIDLRGKGADVEQETFHGTFKQAQDYREKRLVELREPKKRKANEAPDTVFDACQLFLAVQEARIEEGEIGRGEFVNKTRHLNQMCGVRIGNKTVGSLTLDDVTYEILNENVKKSLGKNRAKKTVRRAFVTIKQMMKWCEDKGWFDKSPAAAIKISLKGEKRQELRRISPNEMRSVIEAAPEKYRKVIQFAAYTGLRAGEQRALTWDDVDLDMGYVHVRSAIKWDGELGAPKTDKSERSVPLPGTVIQMLREWKMRQPLKERTNNLVFPTSMGYYADHCNWRNRGLQATCLQLGLDKMTWHDLRHFYASVLIFDAEVSDPQVAAFLGHSDLGFTYKEYARYFADRDRDVVIGKSLDRVFKASGQ